MITWGSKAIGCHLTVAASYAEPYKDKLGMITFAIQSAFPSLFWFGVGFIISMTGINPFLMLLFFDLPTAISFLRKGYFHSKAPIICYLAALLIVVAITFIGWNAAKLFAQFYFQMFIWGLSLALIPGIAALFKIQENLIDFIQDNQLYLSPAGIRAFANLPINSSSQQQKTTPSHLPAFFKFFTRFKIKLRIGKFQILIQ